MTDVEFTLRLVSAMIAGLLIGFERQWNHKSAGLRTNNLVSLGASIFVILSIMLTEKCSGYETRIIGQVVTGVGFLCAGIIFKEGINVHGVNYRIYGLVLLGSGLFNWGWLCQRNLYCYCFDHCDKYIFETNR